MFHRGSPTRVRSHHAMKPPTAKTRSGDILAANDLAAIFNPVNCVGVMGKGLALQFARRYPQLVKPYQAACRRGRLTVERPLILPVNEDAMPRYVVNLATKVHWRNPSRLAWIKTGLDSMYQQLRELGVDSVGIPPLGSGLGGLQWTNVMLVIEQAAGRNHDIRTVLYLPR